LIDMTMCCFCPCMTMCLSHSTKHMQQPPGLEEVSALRVSKVRTLSPSQMQDQGPEVLARRDSTVCQDVQTVATQEQGHTAGTYEPSYLWISWQNNTTVRLTIGPCSVQTLVPCDTQRLTEMMAVPRTPRCLHVWGGS